MAEAPTVKVKVELPQAAVDILNEIASDWRTERHNLKIGVATVCGEFILERLRRDPEWKKRLASVEAPSGPPPRSSLRPKAHLG